MVRITSARLERDTLDQCNPGINVVLVGIDPAAQSFPDVVIRQLGEEPEGQLLEHRRA